MKSRYLAMLAAMALVLAACGGDDAEPEDDAADEPSEESSEEPEEEEAEEEEEPEEEPEEEAEPEAEAASLDCNNIEFIVPFAPGGGSDQQVRRLEPGVSEALDANVNIVYREGGAGASAWLALKESEPDGCTVANLAWPNIVLSSMEDDEEAFAADEFTHLGVTEASFQTVAVPIDSEFEDIEQFLEEARARPGELTIGGAGLLGEVATSQITDATGVDLSYVPMEGGAADAVALLVGGHVDAATFNASHVEVHSDTIRGLAASGETRGQSEHLVDVPTFHELGYEGVDLALTFGVIGPPDMPEEIAQLWNDAINQRIADPEIQQTLIEGGLTPLQSTLEEAEAFNLRVMETFGLR